MSTGVSSLPSETYNVHVFSVPNGNMEHFAAEVLVQILKRDMQSHCPALHAAL